MFNPLCAREIGGQFSLVWSLVCLLMMFLACNLSMNVFWANWTKCHPSHNHKKILQTKLSESFYHYHYWLLLVVGLVSFSVQSQHLGMSFLWIKFLLQVIIIFFICWLWEVTNFCDCCPKNDFWRSVSVHYLQIISKNIYLIQNWGKINSTFLTF